MSQYDPLAGMSCVPPELEYLSRHPERGQWKAAALLGRTTPRWPNWPLEMAVAAVTGELKFEAVEFIVRPPFGWTENERHGPPAHLSLENVAQRGLSARQVVDLLNQTLGTMRVANNFSFGESVEHTLKVGSGIKPTWCCALFQFSESSVCVALGDHAYVKFGTRVPAEGLLLERVTEWAKGYVTAQRALEIFTAATAASGNEWAS